MLKLTLYYSSKDLLYTLQDMRFIVHTSVFFNGEISLFLDKEIGEKNFLNFFRSVNFTNFSNFWLNLAKI